MIKSIDALGRVVRRRKLIPIDRFNYDYLTIIEDLGMVPDARGGRRRMCKCKCRCGSLITTALHSLKTGNTRSCGCRRCDTLTRHGATKNGVMTRCYKIWAGMNKRCTNPKSSIWHNYGGRGIQVCERWKLFENFFEDMGDPPPKHSLDRIDNDGNYEPENCRWATQKEQTLNMRKTRYLTIGGIKKPLQTWAEELGINVNTLRNRVLYRGWTVEDAINIPMMKEKLIEFRGEYKSAREWARFFGIKIHTFWSRRSRGWPMERIATQKIGEVRQ